MVLNNNTTPQAAALRVSGFINVQKPAGMTSHDVIAKLRRWTQIKRIGHAGTLDPAAEGVLPVAIGSSSRLITYLPSQKVYLAEILLGTSTTTDDLCGSIIEEKSIPSSLNQTEIDLVLRKYTGQFEQKPPVYSAVHKNGERLYVLARQILENPSSSQSQTSTALNDMLAAIKPRPVSIAKIDLLQIKLPIIQLRIFCAAGTYIRALARDIGQSLGCGACLKSLCREQSGFFTIEKAITLSEIETAIKAGQLPKILLTPDVVFAKSLVYLDLPNAILIAQGGSLALETIAGNITAQHCLAVYQAAATDQHIQPVAMCVIIDDKMLKPKVVIASAKDLH